MAWTASIPYAHALFGRGVESLLRTRAGVIVKGAEKTGEDAFARIKVIQPDVIIVEAESDGIFSRLIQEQPRARVIRLSLRDNAVTYYSGRSCTVDSVEDLVQSVMDAFAFER